jgi:D-alanyl-lipoteichoic acid acyltransferase DltB (MBOAT superfamily)
MFIRVEIFTEYEVFMMLLKLDLFFFVIFSSQFIVLVLHPRDIELVLTVCSIPFSILAMMMALYALRREHKTWMLSFMGYTVAGIAYFLFKLIRMYVPSQRHKYLHSVKFLTFTGSVCLFLMMLTFVSAVRCIRYFKKGLRERIAQQETQNRARSMTL